LKENKSSKMSENKEDTPTRKAQIQQRLNKIQQFLQPEIVKRVEKKLNDYSNSEAEEEEDNVTERENEEESEDQRQPKSLVGQDRGSTPLRGKPGEESKTDQGLMDSVTRGRNDWLRKRMEDISAQVGRNKTPEKSRTVDFSDPLDNDAAVGRSSTMGTDPSASLRERIQKFRKGLEANSALQDNLQAKIKDMNSEKELEREHQRGEQERATTSLGVSATVKPFSNRQSPRFHTSEFCPDTDLRDSDGRRLSQVSFNHDTSAEFNAGYPRRRSSTRDPSGSPSTDIVQKRYNSTLSMAKPFVILDGEIEGAKSQLKSLQSEQGNIIQELRELEEKEFLLNNMWSSSSSTLNSYKNVAFDPYETTKGTEDPKDEFAERFDRSYLSAGTGRVIQTENFATDRVFLSPQNGRLSVGRSAFDRTDRTPRTSRGTRRSPRIEKLNEQQVEESIDAEFERMFAPRIKKG